MMLKNFGLQIINNFLFFGFFCNFYDDLESTTFMVFSIIINRTDFGCHSIFYYGQVS